MTELCCDDKNSPHGQVPKALRLAEPVAWRVHPFDYGIGHEGVYAMTMREE